MIKLKKTTALLLVALMFVSAFAFAAVGCGSENKEPDNTEAGIGTPAGQSDVQSEETEAPAETQTPEENKPLAGLTVCIDPGHQGKGNSEKEPCAPWGADKNPSYNSSVMKAKCASGTTGKYTNIPEYIVTLDISNKVKASLEKLGATVIMTRESHDVDLSNIERAKIGNDAKANVAIRIHCNGAESESAEGIDVYVRGAGDGSDEYAIRANTDFAMASELLDCLVESTGAKKRNVNKSDAYSGINWSEVPCIIIECGFMSNEKEDALLNDADYQQKIADGIAKWASESKYIKG